jgi:hypothetical protein
VCSSDLEVYYALNLLHLKETKVQQRMIAQGR